MINGQASLNGLNMQGQAKHNAYNGVHLLYTVAIIL